MTDLDVAMGLALEQARLALSTDDVPVGAVVLAADGSLVASGHNERQARRDPTAHAELIALRRAAEAVGDWQLAGCTLVVTLEPCAMCAGAISQARIARLVFGAWDDKAGAAGSVWDLVRDRRLNHRPEVVTEIRQTECSAMLAQFFAGRR